jgi:hypothetical protein
MESAGGVDQVLPDLFFVSIYDLGEDITDLDTV